jgi:plastocyanin
MRATPAILLALAAVALAGGCGSSSGSGSTSGQAEVVTVGGTTSTPATGTTERPAPGANSPGSGRATAPKINATPKFATPSPSEPVRSGNVPVAYHLITIRPDTLRVKVGTTVTWTNYDSVEHNVTSVAGPQRIASKNFGGGKSFSVKLTRPGTIHYLCTIHPTTMNGTIEVLR